MKGQDRSTTIMVGSPYEVRAVRRWERHEQDRVRQVRARRALQRRYAQKVTGR